MDDCRFCEIVAGEREAHVVARSDRAMAFLDANPAAEGHVLVVPTDHAEDLLRLDRDVLAAVVALAHEIATTMDDVLEPDGFSVFHTTGGLVGTVEHAHLHVIPRNEDDGIHLALERQDLDEGAAEGLTRRLRSHLS